jgi:hypothetical protein
MTVYVVTGHMLGPPPDASYVEPESVRIALQSQGVGSTVDLTLAPPAAIAAEDQGVIETP